MFTTIFLSRNLSKISYILYARYTRPDRQLIYACHENTVSEYKLGTPHTSKTYAFQRKSCLGKHLRFYYQFRLTRVPTIIGLIKCTGGYYNIIILMDIK